MNFDATAAAVCVCVCWCKLLAICCRAVVLSCETES